MKRYSYREYILVFLLIIAFVISLALTVLSNRTDKVEGKIDSIEQDLNKVYD